MEKNTNNAAEFIPETQYYSQSKINHRERINFLFTGMKLCICLFLFLDLERKSLCLTCLRNLTPLNGVKKDNYFHV